jgi:hypothetical protein
LNFLILSGLCLLGRVSKQRLWQSTQQIKHGDSRSIVHDINLNYNYLNYNKWQERLIICENGFDLRTDMSN